MKPHNYIEYLADKKDRSCFRRVRGLCMMPADVRAFSDELSATFPAIRFVSVDYWKHFVDIPRWEADCREHVRHEKLGLPNVKLRRHMRDPADEPPHYWSSLADPAERAFYVWLEPSGWRPVWGPENEDGVRYLENTPRLWFQFTRSDFQHDRPRGGWADAEPRPKSARDSVVLQGYQFLVRWSPREPEAEAFGKKVYNILRKLTGCEFKVFEPDSRRAYDAETWRTLKQCLAGRHALAWSLKRRHNYLKCDHWANLLKSADYQFRTGDIFTKAELRQWRANEERKVQEALRLQNEAYERFRGQNGGGGIEFEFRGGKLIAARLYKQKESSSAPSSTPEASAESRIALELRVHRRNGRADWR